MIELTLKISHNKGSCVVRINSETGEIDVKSEDDKTIIFPRHWRLIQKIINAARECEEFGKT